MTMHHDPEHEETLLRLCAGDLAPDGAPARELLAACPECAARWSALRDLARGIDASDRERRAVLAEASVPASSPGADRVREVLERERARTFGLRSRSRWSGSPARLLLLAAALLVAGFFVARVLWPSKPERDDISLSVGGAAVEFLAPFDTLRALEPIAWKYPDLPDGGRYVVSIDGTFPDGRAYSKQWSTPTSTWTPTAEFLRAFPDRVVVRVTAVGLHDRPLASSPELSLSVAR